MENLTQEESNKLATWALYAATAEETAGSIKVKLPDGRKYEVGIVSYPTIAAKASSGYTVDVAVMAGKVFAFGYKLI